MTVKELIEKLKEIPEDTKVKVVHIQDEGCDTFGIFRDIDWDYNIHYDGKTIELGKK